MRDINEVRPYWVLDTVIDQNSTMKRGFQSVYEILNA